MLIRLKNKSKAMELTSQEFEEMVKNGSITPDSLVKNKFIANGSWVSVTNLEMFHRFSTVEHPPGPYLLEKRKIEAKREMQRTEQEKLMMHYFSGKMIEERLALIPVKDLCAHFQVSTASRLTVMPAFEPELAITLFFSLTTISIETIRGATQIWRTIPQYISRTDEDGTFEQIKPIPFDRSNLRRNSFKIPCAESAVPFNSIPLFLEHAKNAVSCSTASLDGISYRHEVSSEVTNIDARWSNPSEHDHAVQCNLISAYEKMICENQVEVSE